jgi:hypothetical protein
VTISQTLVLAGITGVTSPAAKNATDYNVEEDGMTFCGTDPYTGNIVNVVPCYSGWVLPAGGEAYLVLQNLNTVNQAIVAHGGNALSGTYWTSTESSTDNQNAYSFIAVQGNAPVSAAKSNTYLVRPVAYF